jgi:diguanylate cyclase (GGDEF)-like protein
MKDDIRYSELLFLRAVEDGSIDLFNSADEKQTKAVGLIGTMYVEMAAALLEDLCIRFKNDENQLFVSRLRGEISPNHKPPGHGNEYAGQNPRDAVENLLWGVQGGLHNIRITYRGRRRIQELRDLLRHERILEPYGILLSLQYFVSDLEEAMKNGPDTPVSVIAIDLDNFKRINTEFGHAAGNEVMKGYLEAVRDGIGLLGEGYRGVGDETVALVIGQGHPRAVELAETIRKKIEAMRCTYKGKSLPSLTASIGVATAPPESRNMDIETLAENRQAQAKTEGKNRVVAG